MAPNPPGWQAHKLAPLTPSGINKRLDAISLRTGREQRRAAKGQPMHEQKAKLLLLISLITAIGAAVSVIATGSHVRFGLMNQA
jgi:hypothetical protein